MPVGGVLVGQPVSVIPTYPRGPGANRTKKGDQAVEAFIDGDANTVLALTYANKGSAVSMAGTIRKAYGELYPELVVKVGPVEGTSDAGVYLSR